jgi:hypothetical protein
MGKGMMRGKVLYRDLFDRRGPLFYFLYGLTYFISNTTFLGVFILEVISFSVFLYFSYKIIVLFLEKKYALLALPVITGAVLNLKSFAQGGSPEEFVLPLITISLFFLLKYYKEVFPKPVPHSWVFINGLIAGCALWIKFSLLGFWFGWMASLLIVMLIKNGIIQGLKASLIFLVGMLTATLPWVIYFGLSHAIPVWIDVYFLTNLTAYSDTVSLVNLLRNGFFGFLRPLVRTPIFSGVTYFGLLIIVVYKNFLVNNFEKISLITCFAFLVLSVYSGGREYIYYSFVFSPFIVFSLIFILKAIDDSFKLLQRKTIISIIGVLTLIIAVSYTLIFNHNTYMLNVEKEDLVQFQYADIIKEIENPSLLTYSRLDLGFYTTANIVPNVRFFQDTNINKLKNPFFIEEQNRYLKEKLVDFIVTAVPMSQCTEKLDVPYLYENYSLLENEIQMYEGIDYCYLLFKKKP